MAAEWFRVHQHTYAAQNKLYEVDPWVTYFNQRHYFANEPTDFGVQPAAVEAYLKGHRYDGTPNVPSGKDEDFARRSARNHRLFCAALRGRGRGVCAAGPAAALARQGCRPSRVRFAGTTHDAFRTLIARRASSGSAAAGASRITMCATAGGASTPSTWSQRTNASSRPTGNWPLECPRARSCRSTAATGTRGSTPAWHPDSRHILEVGNLLFDTDDNGRMLRIPDLPRPRGWHPSLSPDGRLFVMDGLLDQYGGQKGEYGIFVCDARGGAGRYHILHRFENTRGARSWRRSDPHPVFSHDGTRIYFNVSDTPWTRLYVAECNPAR